MAVVPATQVLVNTEQCVDIPDVCSNQGASCTSCTSFCGYYGILPGQRGVRQICVARGTAEVRSGNTVTQAAKLPTSFCAWPGIYCAGIPNSPGYSSTNQPSQYACPSGIYIYQKYGTAATPSTWIRTALWSSFGGGDGEACNPTQGMEWAFCLKWPSTATWQYGIPTIQSTQSGQVTVTVPRTTNPTSSYECKFGFDSQKRYTLAYCP